MLKRPTIRTYLISMNMVLLGLLFPVFSFLFLREMVHLRDIQLERNINTIRQSLATRSAALVRSTALAAKEAIAGYDFTFLQNLLAQVTQDDPEIRSCMILNKDFVIVAHSSIDMVGNRLSASAVDTRIAHLVASKFSPSPSTKSKVEFLWPLTDTQFDQDNTMQSVFPIYSGQTLWGAIRCDYSLVAIDKQIGQAHQEWTEQLQQVKRYFFTLLLVFLTLGLIIAILLTRSFVRVTQVLHSAVRQVAAGDLSREISRQGLVCEEFVGLAEAFNTMTEKLRLSYQQLDDYSKSLEEKVAARTKALQEAQGIMIRQAHEAGLAEMAVGVLHNIGNAITPAQVAATVLGNQLGKSTIRTRLSQSLTPLREYLTGRQDLSEAERQRFAAILTHLPDGIAEEYDRIIRQLNDICDKHHHIENIIKLQMRYAKVVENPGQVELSSLAADAMNILADAMAKRQIAVHLDLQSTPLVRAEETKLLQVMVNLIKNGYEALDNQLSGRRELTISTGQLDDGSGRVFFRVRDSGCGFKAEDRERLFTFAFSTKERGSGFGLHSCANFIKAIDGSIEALSDGPDQGASFTVLLPAIPAAAPSQANPATQGKNQ